MISIEIAKIPVLIDNCYSYIEGQTEKYRTDKKAFFEVSASKEEIEEERRIAQINYPDNYLESIVVYKNIAEILPNYEALVFHGSVINIDGKAYAITAHSGVGKTTHTRLWLKHFQDRVHVLNGDKPIVRFIDGKPYACGTPWQGKENYGVNEIAPLCGIAFLERGEKNEAWIVDGKEVVEKIFGQVYTPKNPETLVKTFELCDRLLKSVRLVSLKCNMEEEAAQIAYRALTCEI